MMFMITIPPTTMRDGGDSDHGAQKMSREVRPDAQQAAVVLHVKRVGFARGIVAAGAQNHPRFVHRFVESPRRSPRPSPRFACSMCRRHTVSIHEVIGMNA